MENLKICHDRLLTRTGSPNRETGLAYGNSSNGFAASNIQRVMASKFRPASETNSCSFLMQAETTPIEWV
jgi:hypothetical protein